jgi:hypothetical protein
MTNHHRKGSMWRHKVEAWFADAGFATTVRGIGYAGDDLLAEVEHNDHWLQLSVEAKNHREITLSKFVDQSVDQAASYDNGTLPVAVIHRPGRAQVDDAYVVLPGWAFIELVTR